VSRIAVYPGSFDPVTRGISTSSSGACQLFDHVIRGRLRHLAKQATFSISERMEMLEECLRDNPRADVDTFSGLLVDYVRSKNSRVLVAECAPWAT